MAQPKTRNEFKNWCLRALGHPVIKIDVDDDQVEDRIDEALEYWKLFHHDAVQRVYVPHQITAGDRANGCIQVANSWVGITRLLPGYTGSPFGHTNLFDLYYQTRLNDYLLYNTTNTLDMYLLNQHLALVDQVYNGQAPIEYNRKMEKLFPYWNWDNVQDGEYVIIEGTMALNPDDYPNIWSDRYLQLLATAYIKKQWGNILKKFNDTKLLGGVSYNGQQIYNEAIDEIDKLHKSIRDEMEEPPRFIVG